MKVWASSGDIDIISPKDVVKLIPKEKVYQTVQQYIQPPSSPITPVFSGYGGPAVQTYSRQVKTIEHYNDEEYFILNSFVKDLHYANRTLDLKPNTFQEAIEDASVECLNNFGMPSHAIVFNPNVVIVGQFDEDTIKFKHVGPGYGALIIYKPNVFSVIHSKEPCPWFQPEEKYGQFVSNILLMETMKRLDLHE